MKFLLKADFFHWNRKMSHFKWPIICLKMIVCPVGWEFCTLTELLLLLTKPLQSSHCLSVKNSRKKGSSICLASFDKLAIILGKIIAWATVITVSKINIILIGTILCGIKLVLLSGFRIQHCRHLWFISRINQRLLFVLLEYNFCYRWALQVKKQVLDSRDEWCVYMMGVYFPIGFACAELTWSRINSSSFVYFFLLFNPTIFTIPSTCSCLDMVSDVVESGMVKFLLLLMVSASSIDNGATKLE